MSAPLCDYFIVTDRGQRPCGAPATHTLNRLTRAGCRLRYCEPHAHHVRTVGRLDVRELRPEEMGTGIEQEVTEATERGSKPGKG